MSVDVKLLPIHFEYGGIPQVITPVLIRSEKPLFLVDCGYAGFVPHLEIALNIHGVTMSDLTDLIITHDDLDHVGSLAEIKRTYPHIRIIAHEIEAPYIESFGLEKTISLVFPGFAV